MIDQPTFYDPSYLFDRYRDMRLDIDNMSYEVIESCFLFPSYSILHFIILD